MFCTLSGNEIFVKRHTKEFKQALIKKLALSPLSLRQYTAREEIGFSTLYSWKVLYHIERFDEASAINPEKWSPDEKFSVVLETASYSDVELGKYCRYKGLYPGAGENLEGIVCARKYDQQ
jgi:hypothetical protein|tara:strand:- start:1485 stop:1847 length:363 start_codon:yes stop_codon:yes gene_type:complete